MPTCISHFHEYIILFFPPKKIDEKVIYLAKQLTIPLSLKSCETVLFTIYAERGKNACELEVYKPPPPTKNKTCVSSNVPTMSGRI